MKLEIKFDVEITQQDIDDIMCSALEGGINYWCRKAEVVGDYLGEYASEQISRGGSLILYDAESSGKWELTLDNFKDGLHQFLIDFPNNIEGDELNGYYIDPSNIDGCDADNIVQYALFGSLIFN